MQDYSLFSPQVHWTWCYSPVFSGHGVNHGSCTNDNINTITVISHHPLPSSPARKVVVEQWGQFLVKDASVLDICHRHSTCSLLSFLCLPHFPHPLCKRCLKNQIKKKKIKIKIDQKNNKSSKNTCLPCRLAGVGVTDVWSQDHSLFSPQVDWNWCYTMVTGTVHFLHRLTGIGVTDTYDSHKTIPCFHHRLTGLGVTDTWWSQDHSLFSPQVDWNWCYTMVTGTIHFLHRLTGIGVTHDSHKTIPCFHHRLTGLGVTDTWWSQDHSLFSPQVDWNWCYTMVTGTIHFLHRLTGIGVTHDSHKTIPCFLHRLTGICVTDTLWSQDHSLFTLEVD